MNSLRFKLWYDLWSHKARTAQVVLIIGIGAAAIGLIIATQKIVATVGGVTLVSRWSAVLGAATNTEEQTE